MSMSAVVVALSRYFNILCTMSMFVCLLQGLAEAMVNVYREAMRVFLPTPAKSHYTFSLRDITRVFQGIVMVPAKRMPDPEKLGRLWAHETYRVFYDRYV